MSLLHIAVLAPFIVALVVMLTYKLIGRVHTGWVVLPVPVVLFAYFWDLSQPFREVNSSKPSWNGSQARE